MPNIQSREDQVKSALIPKQKMIQSILGDETKSKKFIATAAKIANDYKLASCNPNSIIDACVSVAEMDLELCQTLNHVYIVPYGKSVQLIVSSRGYTTMLSRKGWKLKSYIVNEEDSFEYIVDGFEESIKYKRNLDAETQTFKYAVALAMSPDKTVYIEVMNEEQIEKHRLSSANQKSDKKTGVWADWFNEMALKTVIKKLVKKLPLGADIERAVKKDDVPFEVEKTKDDFDVNSLITNASELRVKETTGEIIDTEISK